MGYVVKIAAFRVSLSVKVLSVLREGLIHLFQELGIRVYLVDLQDSLRVVSVVDEPVVCSSLEPHSSQDCAVFVDVFQKPENGALSYRGVVHPRAFNGVALGAIGDMVSEPVSIPLRDTLIH